MTCLQSDFSIAFKSLALLRWLTILMTWARVKANWPPHAHHGMCSHTWHILKYFSRQSYKSLSYSVDVETVATHFYLQRCLAQTYMFERPDAKSARAQTPFDLLASTSDQPVVAISAPFSLGTHNRETLESSQSSAQALLCLCLNPGSRTGWAKPALISVKLGSTSGRLGMVKNHRSQAGCTWLWLWFAQCVGVHRSWLFSLRFPVLDNPEMSTRLMLIVPARLCCL